jgi:hypothetical protein
MKRLLLACLPLFSSQVRAESGLKYWYSSLSSDFEYYTGTRTKGAKVNVHEFSLADSSGAFSAALQTTGNRMAAEAGAINEERRKIEKGESMGGSKMLSYSYEKAMAREGDAKIYSLRLGSTENAFSSETFSTDRNKDGMVTYAEIAMVAAVDSGVLYQGEYFGIGYDVVFGARWGGIRVNDLKAPKGPDVNKNAGYFYLPLSYRLSFFLPFGVKAFAEYGQDPITLVRHVGDRSGPKIPLDSYINAALEYRYEIFGVGFQYEAYRGSVVTNWGESVVNPVYKHETMGLYAVVGM